MANYGKLIGQSALIAGLSNPIGFAISKLLAAEGCQLHMADLNEQALDNCINEISELHKVDMEAHLTDLSEPINIAVLALECQDVNIIINNLGSPATGSINQLECEDWKTSFELTLFAAINLTKEVLENLYEQKSGIIINVISVMDGTDDENLCIISVNAALQAFSKSLDKKTKPNGIRVLSFISEENISSESNATAINRLILENYLPKMLL
jgi:short-subunit dehydrogenase